MIFLIIGIISIIVCFYIFNNKVDEIEDMEFKAQQVLVGVMIGSLFLFITSCIIIGSINSKEYETITTVNTIVSIDNQSPDFIIGHKRYKRKDWLVVMVKTEDGELEIKQYRTNNILIDPTNTTIPHINYTCERRVNNIWFDFLPDSTKETILVVPPDYVIKENYFGRD